MIFIYLFMEKWNCGNQQNKITQALNGKTILKFDFPYTIEFTDGTAIKFVLGNESWRQEITFYEAGETR